MGVILITLTCAADHSMLRGRCRLTYQVVTLEIPRSRVDEVAAWTTIPDRHWVHEGRYRRQS